VKNAAETDVDCGGGACGKCADDKACAAASDCVSGVCTANKCVAPACTDTVKNGTESDVDCGGTCSAKCALTKQCVADADCGSGHCSGGPCARSIVALTGANVHGCGIRHPGTVKCWGNNTAGRLGYGDTTSRGSTAASMAGLANVDLGTGRTAKKVIVQNNTCAILDDNSLKCWGANDVGQLGLGDTAARGDNAGELGDALAKIDLGTGRTVKDVALGENFACAILDNDTLKCWGANNRGQLGLGDTQRRGDAPGEMGDALPVVDLGTGRKPVTVVASH
jgi:alpha-tubulin suppressor-like RCC1 family protein